MLALLPDGSLLVPPLAAPPAVWSCARFRGRALVLL